METIKRAEADTGADDPRIRADTAKMLADIERRGEDAVVEIARDLDGWDGDFILADDIRQRLIDTVPAPVKEDLRFAHDRIRRFAEAQRDALRSFETTDVAGVRLGQRIIPIATAGCYVPGGRFAHAASALMSITTARVAGVGTVVAASPPRGRSIHAAVAYAMDLAGADLILQMGGAHAVAAMAFGLFGVPAADVIAGPGNAYVTEAKRQLFGRVGIDLLAGPTESAIIADADTDPMTVAVDLVSQAEHGPTSPVWLITTSRDLGRTVLRLVPQVIDDMPDPSPIHAAWRDHGEIVYCPTREEACAAADGYAPEHLHVMAAEPDWWLERLRNYGSLFLGEAATVTHGDKCSGPNHILPTRGAARFTGGLNVYKFMKTVTWQQVDADADGALNRAAARISRTEGMEGHARACDWRRWKGDLTGPDDEAVYRQKRYE